MYSLSGVFTFFRLGLSYGKGLLVLLFLDMCIWLQRPDIVDFKNRIHDIPVNFIRENYDFIIIGGGSAGATLAARLSEVDHWYVLLLEAGPDEPYVSDIPLMFPGLQRTHLDWKFQTETSDSYCLAMSDGRCNWPRGKVLGGCSVLNAMLYIRGNKKDYDLWEAAGNPGWSYEDVLYYFKKMENMRDPALINDPYHGTDGPLTVEHFRYQSNLSNSFLEAADQLNLLHPTGDLNGQVQSGFAWSHGTLRDGLRCSTAKAYLRPCAHRKNLHISLDSFVEKILIHDETKQAYGVVFNKHGNRYTVFAEKEVILSAGGIQSPQMLKISGIGPKDELEKHDIPLIYDAPGVGQNLQDHICGGGGTYLIKNPDSNKFASLGFETLLDPGILVQFVKDKNGALYTLGAAEVMGFISTKFQDSAEDFPDIQVLMGSYTDTSDTGIYSRKAGGLSYDYYGRVYGKYLLRDAFMIFPVLLRPKSRGQILLRSKNPQDHPLIYPNYFTDPNDLETLVTTCSEYNF
jgi:glucose 1-dehydrogenase (FAD, quinone)